MDLFKRATNLKLLLLLFALSCLLRLPNLNRPLATQWEQCTGISLMQLDIWQKSGAHSFHYLLPLNYPGVKDLHIQNWEAYKQAKDAEGNYYYLSFPPFYLLVPYFLNKLFSFPISPLSLQLLNIFLHFLTLLLILKISRLVFSTKSLQVDTIGLTACFIYTLSPSPLWFHTNIYIMFPFAIPILLVSTYLFLRIRLFATYKPLHYILLGITLFLLCYTEWVGYLTSFTYIILGTISFIKHKQRKELWLILTSAFTALLTLGLFVWQGATAVGLENLFNFHFAKYNEYSGSLQGSNFQLFLSRLALWFGRGYAPAILALIGLLLIIWRKKQSLKDLEANPGGLLIAALVIPSVLHHFLLRDFTIHHEFSTLIDGLTLSFLGGILVHYCIKNRIINKKTLLGLAVMVFAANSLSFFLQHYPGPRSFNGYPYNVAQKIGTKINENAIEGEAVFLVGFNREYDWQLIWYAKTNVGFCKDFSELTQKMQELKLEKAKAFVLDPSYMYTGKVAYIKEIRMPIK